MIGGIQLLNRQLYRCRCKWPGTDFKIRRWITACSTMPKDSYKEI